MNPNMASRLAWSLGQPLPQHFVPFQKCQPLLGTNITWAVGSLKSYHWNGQFLIYVDMFNRSIHQKPTYRIIESVHPCTPIYQCHKRSSWTWSNHWGNKKDTTWDSGFQNIYLHMLEFTNPKKHHRNRTSTVYPPTAISKSNHLSH